MAHRLGSHNAQAKPDQKMGRVRGVHTVVRKTNKKIANAKRRRRDKSNPEPA